MVVGMVVGPTALLSQGDVAKPENPFRIASLGSSSSPAGDSPGRRCEEPESTDDERHVVRGKTEPCGNAADTG
jgi:hypothetical protein